MSAWGAPDVRHQDGDGSGLPNWLIVGSTGRVGRLLMTSWARHPPRAVRVTAQGRSASAPVVWDPLAERMPTSARPLEGVLVLAGAVPGPGVDFTLNGRLAQACIRAASEHGVKRVIVASSSAVYGARADLHPFNESDETRPLGEYGASKLAMEQLCQSLASDELNVCCLRIGNVAGADALLLAAARERSGPLPIDQFADGRGPRRSYIGPATLARTLESLFVSPQELPLILNVAAPVPLEMSDLADAAGVDWTWSEASLHSRQHIVLDCSRLAAYHHFEAVDSKPTTMTAELKELGERN